MIWQLADGDTTKYQQVSLVNDIDDFILWVSFNNRKNNIEKYFINKDTCESQQITTKKKFTDPQEAFEFFRSKQQ